VFHFITDLFSPKIEAKIHVQGFFGQEKTYFLQNAVKAWGLPGQFRLLSKSLVQIDLEGRQSKIERCIEHLRHNPNLGSTYSIAAHFLPYKGKYPYFRVHH